MSRNKRYQNLRESKARRQKQLAIGGGVVLAVLLAWEVPHYLHGSGSSSTPPAAATSTTAAGGSSAASATTSGSMAGTATTAGTAAAAGAPTKPTKLPNSDVSPRRTKSQLASFSHFTGKDPFVQQVTDQPVAPPGSGSGATAAPTSSAPAGSASSTAQQGSARTLARTGSVTIAVNGKDETVQVGGTFPSSNPVFRLVSVSRGKAQIGIANGSYKSGAQTVSLGAGKSLTLVDSTDGVRYELRLVSGA